MPDSLKSKTEQVSFGLERSTFSVAAWLAIALYAFAGGYGDATGFLLARTFTGHITGNLVMLALTLPHPHWAQVFPRIVAILTFVVATALGSLLTAEKSTTSWLLFLAQCLLLGAVCLPLVLHSPAYPILLMIGLCLCLGLQNGVVNAAANVDVHATFISGDTTTFIRDQMNRLKRGDDGRWTSIRKPTSLITLTVICCFATGAACAALALGRLGSHLPLALIDPLFLAAVASFAKKS